MTVDDVLERYAVSAELREGRVRYRMPDRSLVWRTGDRNDIDAPLVRQLNGTAVMTGIEAITAWGTRKVRMLGDAATVTREVDTETWFWCLTIEARLSIQTTVTVQLRENENTLATMALAYVDGDDCGPMLLDYLKDFLREVLTSY